MDEEERRNLDVRWLNEHVAERCQREIRQLNRGADITLSLILLWQTVDDIAEKLARYIETRGE